jgi:hypothetical protein
MFTPTDEHPIALWSAVASFFASILAIGAINIFNPDDELRFVGGVFVGLITGGAVYARERLNYAKQESNAPPVGQIVVSESEGKKQYSLELGGDPDEVIDPKKEVRFKVVKRKP